MLGERLAKVAGILLAYPDLRIQIEGHTDNVGGAEYNQQLSEHRANSVREFLITQGVSPANIIARGFGMTQAVASNATVAGRQLNRRVDLVVSGEAIGTMATPAQLPSNPMQKMPTATGNAGQTPTLPAGTVNPQPQTPPPVPQKSPGLSSAIKFERRFWRKACD